MAAAHQEQRGHEDKNADHQLKWPQVAAIVLAPIRS